MSILYSLNFLRKFPGYTFRSGPVPYTGKSRGYHYMRSPKTTNENRATSGLQFDQDEFPVHIGSVKARGMQPTSYDDIGRCITRSWKRHRKTQWK